MGWNHRILAHEHKGEVYLRIHEVYYDENGKPSSYTKNAISIEGTTIKSITWTLNRMKECKEKPILYAGDKFPAEYKYKKTTNMKNIKQLMLEFINEYSDHIILKVLKIEVQDWDGKEGCIGENYIVDFEREEIDSSTTSGTMITVPGQAAVNKKVFDSWRDKQDVIKFL